jgi:hypothetical protein
MPKSVNPTRPAQAGLRCLLPGTDCCDENGGIAAAPNARFPLAQRSLSVFSRTSAPCLGPDWSSVRDTVRIAHPISGRPSPDRFGKVFHVASPIQDQIGVITPSSLHYIATTRGSYMPDIDPKTHTVMIHGLVDQPLTFTMDDLKRFPQVTKLHFVECAGNRRTVEVSTDGGKTWKPAQIVGTPQHMAHVRFTYPWNWDGVSDLN